jgi:hypothetical protein
MLVRLLTLTHVLSHGFVYNQIKYHCFFLLHFLSSNQFQQMATAAGKARCMTCRKEKSTVRCDGCSQSFCYNHFEDHRQQLNQQVDGIEVSCDLLRKMLMEQTMKPEKHALIQQIDQWEHDSLDRIRQTAEETRQLLLKDIDRHFTDTEVKLNELTIQIRISRDENNFFETDLEQWEEQLTRLKEELNKPSTITLTSDSTPLVTKIYLNTSCKHSKLYLN